MKIVEIIWIDTIVEKLSAKHSISIYEVEFVLKGRHYCRLIEKGKVDGEHVYSASGRTADGRFIIVFYIVKKGGKVLPISARDMDITERRIYGRS
jgi:uncharacterized DUF497 family protein